MSKFFPKIENSVPSDVKGKRVKRAYPVVFQVSAAKAVAQDLVSVMAAVALTVATQEITANLSSPAVPRSLRVKGNQAGVAGNVVVTGTNFQGVEITETFALNGANAVEGVKAFKTITQVDLPVQVNAGTDTVSIGAGNNLGLPYKLSHKTVFLAFRGGTKEGTLPTMTISEAAIEENTVLLNSALNDTAVDVYLLV